MAKSKLVRANEKIAEKVVGGYQKIEDAVVGGYKKIEDSVVSGHQRIENGFVARYLTRDGESVEEAKARSARRSAGSATSISRRCTASRARLVSARAVSTWSGP